MVSCGGARKSAMEERESRFTFSLSSTNYLPPLCILQSTQKSFCDWVLVLVVGVRKEEMRKFATGTHGSLTRRVRERERNEAHKSNFIMKNIVKCLICPFFFTESKRKCD